MSQQTMPQAAALETPPPRMRNRKKCLSSGKNRDSVTVQLNPVTSESLSHGIKEGTRGSQVRGKDPQGGSAGQGRRAAGHSHSETSRRTAFRKPRAPEEASRCRAIRNGRPRGQAPEEGRPDKDRRPWRPPGKEAGRTH